MVAVLVACLLAAPTDCRTVEILLLEPSSVGQFIEAQTRAADWLSKHPGMAVKTLTVLPGRGA